MMNYCDLNNLIGGSQSYLFRLFGLLDLNLRNSTDLNGVLQGWYVILVQKEFVHSGCP